MSIEPARGSRAAAGTPGAAPRPSAAQAVLAGKPLAEPPAADRRLAFDRPLRAAVPTAGVGRHWTRFVPSPLRFVGVAVAAGVGRAIDWAKGLVGTRPAPAVPTGDRARAEAVYASMEDRLQVPGLPGMFVEKQGGLKPATVWPHGQVIGAALDLAELTGDWSKVDASMRTLSAYETHGAYSPGIYTWNAKRLWDDNAWVGLDFLQAYAQTGNQDYLAKAEGLFPYMVAGLHQDGGVYWEERNARMTRNTCANAPAIQLALKLYQATGKQEYKAYALNLHQFMNASLRSPEGLYYDHLGDDGGLDKTFYSYNQGAAIGAELMLYQVTGDPQALARARQTANAALAHFGKDDGIWKGAPCFNAIFFRNLLVLDTFAPDPRYRETLKTYVDRVWKDGRDPATGLLDRGGIGRYGDHDLLDEAGLAQMNALLAWPKERLRLVA